MALLLNGFAATLSGNGIDVFARQTPSPKDVAPLRREHGEEWFMTWREGVLYGIPRVTAPSWELGRPVTLDLNSPTGLAVISSRINDCLPAKFPKYEALQRRPFVFLGRRDEIVERVCADLENLHPLVAHFKIRPRFELDARLYELRDDDLRIGVFLSVRTKWDIYASIAELEQSGVDVVGLNVVRKQVELEQRRYVGRIVAFDGSKLTLSDTIDGTDAVIAAQKVWIEGSRKSFRRCLGTLLGRQFGEFENRREFAESEVLNGKALNSLCRRMQQVLSEASPIELTSNLSCTIANQIVLANEGSYKTVVQSEPSEYCFDPSKAKRAQYAWFGLTRFGPYSRDTFTPKSPRILVVSPDSAAGRVSQFVKAFRDGITSIQNSRFDSGFGGVFRLHNAEFVTCQVPVRTERSEPPAKNYKSTVEEFLRRESTEFDAAIIILLDEQAHLPDAENPYLAAKAVLLMAGIAVQEAKLSTISRDAYSSQYIYQNIAIALYAKMGGVPWTVDQGLTADDEIVVGVGTAQLGGNRFDPGVRNVGITTVFRGDGNYLLSNLSRECSFEEYPDVLRQTTMSVLREVKEKNNWRPGDTVRVVFHAFKPFKNVEVAEILQSCTNEVGMGQRIEFAFLTVANDHSFRIIDASQQGIEGKRGGPRKGVFVPERGLIAQLGGFTRLVTANGPTLIKRSTSPLPAPLLVHLHRSSTYRDQRYLAEQVLKFTTLSWRSTLPSHEPVTILYSEMIAGLLGRLKVVPNWSPSALSTTRLRHCMWFL